MEQQSGVHSYGTTKGEENVESQGTASTDIHHEDVTTDHNDLQKKISELHLNSTDDNIDTNHELADEISKFESISPAVVSNLESVNDTVDSNFEIKRSQVRKTSNKVPKNAKYINFPFLCDEETISHINKSYVMFILRGLSGSGKSTIVNLIKDTYDNVAVCSADDYFLCNDEYHFNAAHLPYAHKQCQSKATDACQKGVNTVVIDNTNVKKWEMKSYIGLANKTGYTVITVVPQTPWRFNVVELAKRNKHNVPAETLASKIDKFENAYPLYWGWFLNSEDTNRLMDLVDIYFPMCCRTFPQIVKKINKFRGTQEIGANFYKLFNSRTSESPTLHCTAFYGGRGKNQDPNIHNYAKKEAVIQAMGQMEPLKVVGITITAATVGARVKLTPKQLLVWAQDDDDECYHYSGSSSPVGKLPPGSRAHITLGVAPGTEAVTTGLDQLHLVQLQLRRAEASCVQIDGVNFKCYKDGICTVDFESPIIFDSVFSGFY